MFHNKMLSRVSTTAFLPCHSGDKLGLILVKHVIHTRFSSRIIRVLFYICSFSVEGTVCGMMRFAVHTVMNFRLAKCTQWMEAAVSFRTVINTCETVLHPEDCRRSC